VEPLLDTLAALCPGLPTHSRTPGAFEAGLIGIPLSEVSLVETCSLFCFAHVGREMAVSCVRPVEQSWNSPPRLRQFLDYIKITALPECLRDIVAIR